MTRVKDSLAVGEGVALGGIGAGGMTLGRDGRFRHVTMNNNRRADEAISEADHAFLAIRVASPTGNYVRALRTVPSESVPFPALNEGNVSCRVRYPRIDYRLKDEACPVKVLWSAFSPVIPYDYEAASMPVVFVGIQFTNLTDAPIEVSALLNWGNLTGRTATRVPEGSTPIKPVTLPMNDEQEKLLRDRRIQADEAKKEKEKDKAQAESKSSIVYNGLEFASPGPIRHNADGEHCLAARWSNEKETSVLAWDPENPSDRDLLSNLFTEGLSLADGREAVSPTPRAGAVCCRFSLPPKGEARADFAISWYCPRFVVNGTEQGNGYTAHFDNATEVALHGLRNLKYFILSINAWHQGFDASSLPPWLKDSLVRGCMPLGVHGIHTRDEGYAQMEDLESHRVGPLEEHWNVSLAAMLLYPRFEVYWLAQYAVSKAPDGVSFARYLGRDTLYEHQFEGSEERRVLHTAIFVLSVCRDYLCTGNIIPLQKGYPRIRQAISDLLEHDTDRDALPDPAGPIACQGRKAHGLSSQTASLWVAALHALGEALEASGKEEDGHFLGSLARRGAAAFEALYWNDKGAYYRLYPANNEAAHPALPSETCHSAQLAGQWATRFLGLGSLFREDRVARALDTMVARNVSQGHILEAVSPDGTPLAREGGDGVATLSKALPLACLLLHENRAGAGLALLEDCFRREALHPGRNTMQAAWYIYYALAGVMLNVPRQHLLIAPNLPEDCPSLRLPLVTSWCLGEMRFQKEWREGFYYERLQLHFDSPITLREIEFRLPPGLASIGGRCHGAGERIDAVYKFSSDPRFTRVVIQPKRPLTVQRELRIELRGEEQAPKREQP